MTFQTLEKDTITSRSFSGQWGLQWGRTRPCLVKYSSSILTERCRLVSINCIGLIVNLWYTTLTIVSTGLTKCNQDINLRALPTSQQYQQLLNQSLPTHVLLSPLLYSSLLSKESRCYQVVFCVPELQYIFPTCVLSPFPSTHPSRRTPCGFWLILPQLEQQVFAGRNGDTWMHPVRILITQCADCAPPLLNNLQKCTRTVNTSAAHAQAHMAAGGHLWVGQIKRCKV